MNSIHDLLRQTQLNLKAPKSQFNKFGNYHYRNCEDILEALKDILPDKCYVLLSDEIKVIGERYYVQAEAKFLYMDKCISTFAYARESLAKKGMDKSQITGATSSYARKYALNGLFLIDDTKDADCRDNSKDGTKSECISSLQFLKNMIVELKIPSTLVSEWLSKAGVKSINELPNDKLNSIISYLNRNKFKLLESTSNQKIGE